MTAALPSHLTFFDDLRELPDDVVAAARPWIDFYKRERDLLTQMTIPLASDPLDKRWTALQARRRAAGTATSGELSAGLRIELPRADTARVLLIEPSPRATCKDRRPGG